MPTPYAPLLNDVLVGLPSAAYTASNSPITFNTNQVTYIAFDFTVTSFTGGTAPSIQFFIDRQGVADGVWYNVLSTSAITSATFNTWDLGPGFTSAAGPNGSIHAIFTNQGRLRWTFGGSVAPTAVTFSASIIGR